MPVPAIGLKKPLPKEWLMPNIILVFYITKVMACRKTMSAPAIGLKKLLLKAMLPHKTILASFTAEDWV